MKARDILIAYERHLNELSAAVAEEDWDTFSEIQDSIEVLQKQFDVLPEKEKQHPVVQQTLGGFVERQQQLIREVSRCKQNVAENIRKLKTAKTQQHGYRQLVSTAIPPVFYDRKK